MGGFRPKAGNRHENYTLTHIANVGFHPADGAPWPGSGAAPDRLGAGSAASAGPAGAPASAATRASDAVSALLAASGVRCGAVRSPAGARSGTDPRAACHGGARSGPAGPDPRAGAAAAAGSMGMAIGAGARLRGPHAPSTIHAAVARPGP